MIICGAETGQKRVACFKIGEAFFLDTFLHEKSRLFACFKIGEAFFLDTFLHEKSRLFAC